MLLNLLINTGSSRPSTNDIIYIFIRYLPTILHWRRTKEKDARRGQTSTEQSEPASRSRGEEGKRYKIYQGRMTRLSHGATKIGYVGTSSVAIVRC